MRQISNYTLATIALVSTVFFTSCSKDEDSDSGPSYDFVDQNLQGSIDGIPFELGQGIVELTTSFEEEEQLSFDLFDVDESQADFCDFFGFGDEVSVFFSIDRAVGIYELSFDLNSFSGQTITLFNPDGAVNNIASIGAVEILTITDEQVTGRIDATLDSESTINGNFTATFCSEE